MSTRFFLLVFSLFFIQLASADDDVENITPIWAGANIALNNQSTMALVSYPITDLVGLYMLTSYMGVSSCSTDLEKKIIGRKDVPETFRCIKQVGDLKIIVSLKRRISPGANEDTSYDQATIDVTGGIKTTRKQLLKKVGVSNSGMEMISGESRMNIKLKSAYCETTRDANKVITGGVCFLNSFDNFSGEFNDIKFKLKLDAHTDPLAGGIFDSIKESLKSTQGIEIQSAESTIATNGELSGRMSARWKGISGKEGNEPRLRLYLTNGVLCEEQCTITTSHDIDLKANKTKTELNQFTGEISRSAKRIEKYTGTMATKIINPYTGSFNAKWNPDVKIYRYYDYKRNDSLLLKNSREEKQITFSDQQLSQAQLYPAIRGRSFGETSKKVLFNEAYNPLSICEGEECTTLTIPFHKDLNDSVYEKQVHMGEISRIGSASRISNCHLNGACQTNVQTINSLYDSKDILPLVISPSTMSGTRVNIWSDTPKPEDLLPIDLFGFPTTSYEFDVNSQNYMDSLLMISLPASLVPASVLYLNGMSKADQVLFSSEIAIIKDLLNTLRNRGVATKEIRVRNKQELLSALEGAPESSLVLIDSHGFPGFISPSGDNGEHEDVSMIDIKLSIEKSKIIGVFSSSCYGASTALPNSFISSILDGLGMSSSGIGDIVGIGTNPLHLSTGKIISTIKRLTSRCR